MNRKIIDSYTYLLKMVNCKISCCLSAIFNFQERIKSYSSSDLEWVNLNWEKEIIRNEKMELKHLKKIKRFLIEEIRFEKMIENVVDKLEAKIYENTKN